MIWCQMKERAYVNGAKVRLSDVATLTGGGDGQAIVCRLKGPGVWRVTALQAAAALEKACAGADITLLGPEACYVHLEKPRQADPWRWLRCAAGFLILLAGSALGLCWFHSDVDMPQAQLAVYRLLTGNEPADPRWITWPYALGVVIGVVIFYALPWQKTVTPMEVRMEEYRADMEQTCARDTEGQDG